MQIMNYCKIKNCDIANGEGIRVSLFVSGCRNHCKGCFQPETWDFEYGKPFTKETEDELVNLLSQSYIAGLTLLGGDPFEPENQKALLPFIKKVKNILPNKNIWAYTGYTLDNLLDANHRSHREETQEMLQLIDVLVDGPFIEAKKDISLRFRGSSNQRLIDMQKTRQMQKIALVELR